MGSNAEPRHLRKTMVIFASALKASTERIANQLNITEQMICKHGLKNTLNLAFLFSWQASINVPYLMRHGALPRMVPSTQW